MGPRTRSRNLAYTGPGRYEVYSAADNVLQFTGFGGQGVYEFETNTDTTMSPPYVTPHNLTIIKREADPLLLNGSVTSGGTRMEWKDYNPSNRSLYAFCPNMSNTIPWSQLKTKAMALMNPSKPAVDLPVFLWEFKDFPRMLQQLGRVLNRQVKASDVAGGYVAWSFGWAPLISDVGKLLNLSKLINDRARYLERLADRKGVRRKLGKHGPFTTTLSDRVYLGHIPGEWYRASRKVVEEGEYWASGKLNLKGALPTGFDERRWQAARAALGLNLSAASLWEALPWSWLIDYFSNVGDILDAQRGFIPFSYKEVCVMARVEVRDELSGAKLMQGIQASGGMLKSTYKQRTVYVAPSPSLVFDGFLTNHQKAILLSLATAIPLRKAGR
jgi:hypothetical protein